MNMFAAVGIILLVAGAILAFAIEREAEGVDLQLVGWIMIAGGGLALVVGLIQGAGFMSLNKTKMRSERHMSSDGKHVVDETETS